MSPPPKKQSAQTSSSTTSNAVSNVVNDLIRASAGASAKNIADEDLDKYVADMILKEAAEKRKKYEKEGIRAYEPSPSRAKRPKLSAGFLLNVVKQTDSSNRAAIRSNQETISKLRQERYRREGRSDDAEQERGRRRRDHRDNRKRHRSGSRSPSRSPSPSSSRHSRSHVSPSERMLRTSNKES